MQTTAHRSRFGFWVLSLAATLILTAGSGVSAGQAPHSGAGSNSQSGTGSNSQSGAGSNSQSGAGSNSQSGAGSNSQSGAGSNSQSGAGSNSQSGAGSNSQSGAGSNSQSGAGSNSQSGAGPNSQSGAGSNSKIAKDLQDEQHNDDETVDVIVQFKRGKASGDAIRAGGGWVKQELPIVDGVVASLPAKALEILAKHPDVAFVSPSRK